MREWAPAKLVGARVDFSKYLKMGGIFERFKDIEFFKDFTINEELVIITWQHELDV